jgi:2-dehydropantoate 2-reductase
MIGGRRYVVLGAGGVGSALGGLLQAAGARVVLIARGPQLEALRTRGLSIRTPSRAVDLAVDTAPDPRAVRFEPDDVVLLCTKSQHSAAALDDLAASAPRGTPIVCAQNGVANEPLAAARFDRVYGLVVFAPIGFTRPGRVTLHSEPVLGGLDLGRHPEGVDALVHEVVADLAAAGFDARAEPRILRWKYGKLLTNLGNALQALVGRSALGSPILARIQDEAIACYRAAGIDFATLDEVFGRYAAVRELPVEGAPRGGGSTWQSLARGSGSVETEHLNGEIVRLGEIHGVATPVNRAITELAIRAAAEGSAPERWTLEAITAAIEARDPSRPA